jgi:hypothetical protein
MGLLTDAQLDSGALRNRLLSTPQGLSYWDETVGRRKFAWDTINNRWQLVYGDTGWRDVTASLIGGWTGTGFLIRRLGNTVHVLAKAMSGAAATTPAIYLLPTGFRSADPVHSFFAQYGLAPQWPFYTIASNGTVASGGTYTAVGNGFGVLTFVTNDAWPATNPGTASGTIPYT